MFFFSGFPTGCYSAPSDIPGGSKNDTVNLTDSDESVIYNIYDELSSSFPNYVTKSVVGEAFSKKINRYTFAFPSLENSTDLSAKPFKVCIITGLHGYEQGSAWTAVQFFRLLCNNKNDPHLGFLRRNMVFDVIPVANPWGFSHNKRKNGNGVDLNRNFEPDFIEGQASDAWGYGGPFPCSETETQVLMRFIEENEDAEVVLDYHNIDKGYPLFYVYGERDVQLAQSVFTLLTEKWQGEYQKLPTDRLLGRVKGNGHKGMFSDYLISKKLWVLTMETPWCMPEIGREQYDSVTIRCALDVLVNTLLIIAQNVYVLSK